MFKNENMVYQILGDMDGETLGFVETDAEQAEVERVIRFIRDFESYGIYDLVTTLQRLGYKADLFMFPTLYL